ncbi:DNA internalization-related competence protein ComEC/Rec2 [Hydrocarboniclastica marina]|nr:DNA internalization-related competence protein ComEC/Rec2 [Hydrocarboniclastica marina]
MRAWMLATLGGAIIIYGPGWAPALAQPAAVAAAAAVLGTFAIVLRPCLPQGYGYIRVAYCLMVLLCGVMTGVGWTAWNAQQRLAVSFPQSLEQQELRVSGYSCSVPAWGAWRSVRQDFCVTRWHDADRPGDSLSADMLPLPARLRLARYGAEKRFALRGPATLDVSLKRPHGSVNPAGFRYETWLYRQGYLATGTIRAIVPQTTATSDFSPVGGHLPEVASEPAAMPCALTCRYHQLRLELIERLSQKSAGMTYAGLFESLLFGSRGQLQPEDWTVLRTTGTSHLVAISGLHIGLVAAMVAFIARLVLLRTVGDRFGPKLAPRLLFVLVCLATGAYALLAGFTVPTQRALVMVIVAGLVLLNGGMRRAWDGWILAAFLVLLLDPFALLDMGFWLSFGAVACLILVFSGRLAPPRPWQSLLLAQLAITLGLWPITTFLGLPVAPLGFLANLFAIPWLSLVVMPVVVLAGPLVLWGNPVTAYWAGVAVDTVLGILWQLLSYLAEQSVGLDSGFPAIGLPLVLLTVMALLPILLPVGSAYRIVAVAVTLMLLFRLTAEPRSNAPVDVPQMVVLDVGQGLSVLLRDGERAMLYDTGPSAGGFSAAESQVLPTLSALGVRKLDQLVLSHSDGDHAGNWRWVAAQLEPETIASGEDEVLGSPVMPCGILSGQRVGRWQLEAWRAAHPASSNESSCVVEASVGDYRVLLSGDMSAVHEAEWLNARHSREPVDVVIAPHHGSKSSSTEQFVAVLNPRYALFSAGYRNRYGHPHPDVVGRYRRYGSEVLSSAGLGAVTFGFVPNNLQVHVERDNAAFWILPPEW